MVEKAVEKVEKKASPQVVKKPIVSQNSFNIYKVNPFANKKVDAP
jgi:hypothetical protein